MLKIDVCELQSHRPNDEKVIKCCLGSIFFGPPCISQKEIHTYHLGNMACSNDSLDSGEPF